MTKNPWQQNYVFCNFTMTKIIHKYLMKCMILYNMSLNSKNTFMYSYLNSIFKKLIMFIISKHINSTHDYNSQNTFYSREHFKL